MKIKVSEQAVRLDKYLSDILDDSRENIIKMIKTGLILVNNEVVKPSYKVNIDDEIEVVGQLVAEDKTIKPMDLDLEIVYEDDDLLIVNKPTGLVVHPANGHYEDTLVNALIGKVKLSDVNGEFRPGIVHRLDKDTSGLMIVAKNNTAHVRLAEELKNRNIKRYYLAMVDGVIDTDTGTIDAPIARDTKNRLKMAVLHNGKSAVTHFEVVKRFQNKTLIKCKLDTGRTHQIRVHLSYIGFPVVNDPLYNKKVFDKCYGQFLHAYKLSLLQPTTKETITVVKEIDNVFLELIEQEGGAEIGY